MGNWGTKITKAGFGVESAEPRDYLFHSAFGTVKIAKQTPNKTYGTVVVPGGGNVLLTITHNLGFVPLVMVFTELRPDSGRWYNGIAIGGPDDQVGIYINNVADGTYVSSTKLYIKYNNTGATKTVKYYYFIFGDSGS